MQNHAYNPPKIVVYSIQRNEVKILPFWIDHYSRFATKIYVYDDKSDDGTRPMLESRGVMVRDCPFDLLDDGQMADFYSKIYKEFEWADWVVLVDADEFIWNWEFSNGLDCDVIEPLGYEMKSPVFPAYHTPITEQIKTGIPARWWSNNGHKPCIIKPSVKDIRFECGRHNISPRKGNSIFRTDKIKLLHYRDIGYDYYVWHHARNANRLHPERRDKTWGKHNFKPMNKEQFALSLLNSQWVIP